MLRISKQESQSAIIVPGALINEINKECSKQKAIYKACGMHP